MPSGVHKGPDMAASMATHPEAATNLALAVIASSNAPLALLDGELKVMAASDTFFGAFQLDPAEAMGREVFARARVPGELLVVRDAGHNDVGHVGSDAYWQWISNALMVHGRNLSRSRSESKRRTEMSG